MTVNILPHARKSPLGRVDLSKEREWLLQHRDEYRGQWVVLGNGILIGHTADKREVAAIVDSARAQGIRAPYAKFVSDDSEPIWMGWL